MFAKKKVFEFHHPKQSGPIKVKASTEQKAWKIVRDFVQRQMFGNWALTYDKLALQREMDLIVCKQE